VNQLAIERVNQLAIEAPRKCQGKQEDLPSKQLGVRERSRKVINASSDHWFQGKMQKMTITRSG
jgi:hypothetical protein